MPKNKQAVVKLIGAFGEGFAMLAAAGGPDTHPHAVSSSEERARWDKDMANFNDDLKKVEKFFLDVLENRLTDEEARKTYFSFFGVQGAWYTVGWKMSVLIEKTFGRKKLIECICDQRKLLPLYNKAAAKYNRRSREPLALWSESLIKIFSNIQAQEPGNPSVKKPALRRELLKRVEQDQAIRNELISKGVENPDKAVLARMQPVLRQIVGS